VSQSSAVRALGEGRPIVFLHIPKTGGNSLSRAFGRLYAPHQQFTDKGNISADYLDRIAAAAGDRAFIWGHPANGALTRVTDKVDIITMLRRPVDQIISNYLHIRENPDDVLNSKANRLSFSEFLQQNPNYIACQTLSIASATREQAFDILGDTQGLMTAVADFLDGAAFVGVLDRPLACCEVLSDQLGGGFPSRLHHLNSARMRGAATDSIGSLREEYFALRKSGRFAAFFAVEEATYAKGSEILARRHESLGGAVSSRQRTNVSATTMDISANMFFCPSGYLDDGKLDYSSRSGPEYLIYGPYCCLAPGDYEAEFRFRLAPGFGLGPLRLEVVANNAVCLSARSIWRAGRNSADRRTLRFRNEHPEDVLEFRIGRSRFASGSLEFSGVSIRPVAEGGRAATRRKGS
jgi:hypothetical protein